MPPTDRLAQRSLHVDSAKGLPEALLTSWASFPLIYRKRVKRMSKDARAGDLVAVYAPGENEGENGEEKLLGYAFYNPKSEILLRLVRRGGELPDGAYFESLLERAVHLRRDLLRLDAVADSYRVIHAEADEFSGFVVDRYGDVLSAEAFSLGMFLRGGAFLETLAKQVGAKHWVLRPSPAFLSQEGVEIETLASPDLPPQVTIQEYGTRFRVRFAGGHKTGFFCDQRDNRKRVAEFCRERTVLDLCCYSGGFAVQAKKLGGASEVTAVDLDENPLAIAKENANLNQVRVNFVQADAFTYMRDRLAHGMRYDVLILDPPKLIRTRDEIEEGTRKHFDLNRLAMQLVKPGGLLLTCSCSGLLSEEEFMKLLVQASRQAGPELPEKTANGRPRHAARPMQILERTGASPDHPVNPFVPETDYLKAVWLRML